MRFDNIKDYNKLRQLVENPWETLRFRKKCNKDTDMKVRFLDGSSITLRWNSRDSHNFHRIFLRDEYRLNKRKICELECVVDIGAYVGLFAYRVSKIAKKVICYEPSPVNFLQLQSNLHMYKNVILASDAVFGKDELMPLYAPHNDRMTTLFSLYNWVDGHRMEDSVSVKAVTLKSVFLQHNVEQCDLLKLDVQGAEYEILYSAGDDVYSRIKEICCEYHNLKTNPTKNCIETLLKFLSQKGYSTEIVPHQKKHNHGLLFAKRN